MALQDIIKTILGEAEKEADKVRKEGEVKVKGIEEEGRKKVEEADREINNNISKEAQKIIDRVKFESNIEERNRVVSIKQQIVDEVFSKAQDRIKDINDEEYVLLLKKLINNLPEVEAGEIVSITGKEELTKKALQESGKNYSISNDSIEGVGGFLFKSDDIEVNNRFEELLSGLKDSLEIEISNKLFS